MGLARGIGTPRGNRVRICASFPRMARGFGAPRGRRVERVPNPLANTTDEEMKRFFDEYEIVDPLQPRDAFYGGRTNATKLFHECQGDEKIK